MPQTAWLTPRPSARFLVATWGLRIILFICKLNETYGQQGYLRRWSGLFNSTRYVSDALAANGVEAEVVIVEDNNSIDREVARTKADVVVLEALWVVPEKFDVLRKLHPQVQWYVHLHSNLPFLAQEGIAMQWVIDCAARGVKFIANSPEAYDAVKTVLDDGDVIYLPNIYTFETSPPWTSHRERYDLHVGCYGALRPLKNQLIQAVAAIEFAKQKAKYLYFHVNSSRVETGGGPVLKNLIQLFDRTNDCELVLEPWREPVDFVEHLRETIDVGMQVSLTETFNIVTADHVAANVPVVVSTEIKWASWLNQARPDSVTDIVSALHRVYNRGWIARYNQYLLQQHTRDATCQWLKWARGE